MQGIRFLTTFAAQAEVDTTLPTGNHGAIVDIAVKNGEVDLDNPPSVSWISPAHEGTTRRELELRIFTLSAESSRLLAMWTFYKTGSWSESLSSRVYSTRHCAATLCQTRHSHERRRKSWFPTIFVNSINGCSGPRGAQWPRHQGPYQVTGRRASSVDPRTWTEFRGAREEWPPQANGYTGLVRLFIRRSFCGLTLTTHLTRRK